jgi:hypothetical protein
MYKPPDSALALWGVLLGAALAFIYFMQLHAMQGQLDVMKLQQRPWVGIKSYSNIEATKSGTPFYMWVDFGNFGQSPAFLKDTIMEMRPITGEQGNLPENTEFSESIPDSFAKNRDPLFPGSVGYRKIAKITMSDDDARQITAGTKTLYLFGRIRYTSADSPEVHTTRFCWFFGSMGTAVNQKGQTTQTAALVNCGGSFAYAD